MRKQVLILAAVLGSVIALLGWAAPTHIQVEREILVERPLGEVFSQVRFLKNHLAWGPWARRDPGVKREFRGIDGQAGFVVAWEGNRSVGAGEQEIVSISEGERLETVMRLREPMADESRVYLLTEARGPELTLVKWGMTGRSPFPLNVICLLTNMRASLGGDFEEALRTMKASLEQR